MGWAKEQDLEHLEFEEERDAAYQEDQSRLRLAMLCTQMVQPLSYDLHVRILELAQFMQCLGS